MLLLRECFTLLGLKGFAAWQRGGAIRDAAPAQSRVILAGWIGRNLKRVFSYQFPINFLSG